MDGRLSLGKCWCVALLVVAGACGVEPGDDPATGNQQEETEAAEEGSPAKTLFESRYSRSGKFQVKELPDGQLLMSVVGLDGVDDGVAAKVNPRSLTGTYRALHPGQAVPTILTSLEDRFAGQFKGVTKQPAPAENSAAIPNEDIVGALNIVLPKEAIFRATFCQNNYSHSDHDEINTHCAYSRRGGALCVNRTAHREFVMAKNDTTRTAVFETVGRRDRIVLQPGQWGTISGSSNFGRVCITPKTKEGVGISRYFMFEKHL